MSSKYSNRNERIKANTQFNVVCTNRLNMKSVRHIHAKQIKMGVKLIGRFINTSSHKTLSYAARCSSLDPPSPSICLPLTLTLCLPLKLAFSTHSPMHDRFPLSVVDSDVAIELNVNRQFIPSKVQTVNIQVEEPS